MKFFIIIPIFVTLSKTYWQDFLFMRPYILIKESFCLCVCSRHYGLFMARRALKFFWGVHLTRSMCARAGIFAIIITFFFKSKLQFFCDFFTSNWIFYTLNSICELDFLIVWAANIYAWNKIFFWKSVQ